MIIYLEEVGVKISYKIAKLIAKTSITPQQITIARFVLSAPILLYFFSQGTYVFNLIGLFLYMFLAIFDWVDGRLAEIKKLPLETKPLGRLVDRSLDRILVLIILSSIFYSGIFSASRNLWIYLSISYYSIYFFLTVLLNEFDCLFKVDIKSYTEIEKQMLKINMNLSKMDKFFYYFINSSNNSIARFCFTVSYPLFLGIITNQLAITFVFLILMMIIRSIVIFYITYNALKVEKKSSLLIEVLKNRFSQG